MSFVKIQSISNDRVRGYMARIEGVDLPRNKRIQVGLTYIYGIGPTRANEILRSTQVNPDTRVKDLTEIEVSSLREYIPRILKSKATCAARRR